MQSVNSSNVHIVGCNSYFQNGDHQLSEHWRTSVTVTLLNVDQEYDVKQKIPKNDFILMFMDRQHARCMHEFMQNTQSRIRKHKMVVILQTVDCDNDG